MPVKKPKSAPKQKVESNAPASAAEPKNSASTSKVAAVQARAGKARTTIKKTPVKKTLSAASSSSSSRVTRKPVSNYKIDIDLQTAKPSIKPKRLSQASSGETTVGACQNMTMNSPSVAIHPVPGRLPRLPSLSTPKSITEATSLFEAGTPVENSTPKPVTQQQKKEAMVNDPQHKHSALSSSSNRPPVSSGSNSLSGLKFHKKILDSADQSNVPPVPTPATTSPLLTSTDSVWLAKLEALSNSYEARSNVSSNSPMMTTQMFTPNFVMTGQRFLVPDQINQRVSHPSAGVHPSVGSAAGTFTSGRRASVSVTRDPRPRPTSTAQTQSQTTKPSFPPT